MVNYTFILAISSDIFCPTGTKDIAEQDKLKTII
jgi:hypothetical protein